MSTLTAFDYIGERSEATPGLWNTPFSILSGNIRAASVSTDFLSSATTFSITTGLEVGGGGHFQYLSVGSTPPSEVTTAAITIAVNSATSDYLYFTDSSAVRSNYIIGSRAGGTADGLNIWDASGDTLIASFSKQSIRLFQNVVGPVFDAGGAVRNVRSYGAVGDGTTDDSGAFALAHDSANTGDTIFVPETASGYKLTSAFTIRKPVTVAGGPASLIFQSATTAENVIYVSATSVKLSGLQLRGNGLLGSTLSSCGVVVRNTADFIIESCSINSAALFGILVSTVTRARVLDNTINLTNPNLLSNNAADIQLQNSVFDAQVLNNRCLSPRKTAGIQLQPQTAGEIVQHCLIVGNSISSSTIVSNISNGHGIVLYAVSSAATVRHVVVMANQVRDVVGMGIYVKGVNGGEAADNIVIGNTIVNAQLQGSAGELADGAITITDARRCIVSGNVVNGGGAGQAAGIVVQDDCSDSLIAENVVTNANSFSQGGIRVIASQTSISQRLRVADNTVVGPTGGAPLIDVEIARNPLIRGNTMLNGAAQGLSLSSTSNAIVIGNYTQGNADWGIRLFSSCSSALVALNGSFGDFAPFLDQGQNNIRYDAGGLVTFRTGSALEPTVAFQSEQSLGFYRSAASAIAMSYGQLQVVTGTALLPGLAFSSESSLGIFRSGASAIGISYGQFRVADGTALLPGLAFSSESSLGWYRSGASTIAASYGTVLLGGKAGINTSTPDKLLHISQDNATTPSIKVGTGTDAQGWYSFWGSDAGGSTKGFIGAAFDDAAAEFQIRVRGTAATFAKLRALGDGTVSLSSSGTLHLQQSRLLSIRTTAVNSGLFTALFGDELAIGVGVSNATLYFRSGNTAYIWGTSSTSTGA